MNSTQRGSIRTAVLAGIAAFSMHGAAAAETKSVVLAGGCFWCVESDFDSVEGVVGTTSGYTGGKTDDPTYKEVTSQRTGHFEAVKIDYDPEIVTYRELVDLFWRSVDPTDDGGQFCDRGPSYRTAGVRHERRREIRSECIEVGRGERSRNGDRDAHS